MEKINKQTKLDKKAYHEIIKNTHAFASLTDADLKDFIKVCKLMPFKAGDTIFNTGDIGDYAYIVAEGVVQIFVVNLSDEEVTLYKHGIHAVFGEMSVLEEEAIPRVASARAITDTVLFGIYHTDLLKILRKHQAVKKHLSNLMKQKLLDKLTEQSQIFKNTSETLIKQLTGNIKHFNPGDIVFHEGEVAKEVYFVLSGIVSLQKGKDEKKQILTKLAAGSLFGELGVLKKQKRFATARVESSAEILTIEGNYFIELYHKNPALKQFVSALHNSYQVAKTGNITEYLGKYMGMDAICSLIETEAGESIISAQVLAKKIFIINNTKHKAHETITFHQGENTRELSFDENNKLIGITCYGQWDELGNATTMVFDAKHFNEWEKVIFTEKGSFSLVTQPVLGLDTDQICNCMGICRKEIKMAIISGAKSIDEISTSTGAGSVCGSCKPIMQNMLGETTWTMVKIASIENHTSNIRSFVLVPTEGKVKHYKPGMHIIIQALIDNNWVERSYTLTSSPENTNGYEITVKRETHGLFSRWLFERAGEFPLMRISAPKGDYTLDLNSEKKAICLMGGIGITPAIAFIRTMTDYASHRELTIYYMTRYPENIAFSSELNEIVKLYLNIKVITRITSEQGRITENDIATIAHENPEAEYFLCGPERFVDELQQYLLNENVLKSNIRIERFVHAGETPSMEPKIEHISNESVLEHIEPHYDEKETEKLILHDAHQFIEQFYKRFGNKQLFELRWKYVQKEIMSTGIYKHTNDELTGLAKKAWKNNVRSMVRSHYDSVIVRDMRHLISEEEIFTSLLEHIEISTNGGDIRNVISVFAPQEHGEAKVRIWNNQLLGYAGFVCADGQIVGDRSAVELTNQIIDLGWKPSKIDAFVRLPIVIQFSGSSAKFFEIPDKFAKEILIIHPKYHDFDALNLKYFALKTQSNLLLDAGGVRYPCTAFSGWHISTDIASGVFADTNAYDLLAEVSLAIKHHTNSRLPLWMDKAQLELNMAVLYSYEKAGVRIFDQHNALDDFFSFYLAELEKNHNIHVEWDAIILPLHGLTTKIFHIPTNTILDKPNFFNQPDPWL